MKKLTAVCALALALTMALAPAAYAAEWADPAQVCYPSSVTQSEDGTEIRKFYEGSPPGSQGSGSGSSGRGLNSMSPARLPPKSATMKIRCLLASRLAPAQYWASMSRQHRSGVPPRTIPAPAHLPEGGIGTSASVKADRTALKSIQGPEIQPEIPCGARGRH